MSALSLCPMCPPGTKPALLTAGLCKWHYAHPEQIAALPSNAAILDLKPAPLINVASKKRSAENRAYSPLRKRFLEERPYCEIKLEGCGVRATDVHHTKGRSGKLLLDTKWWKPTCRSCHTYITENSEEAIERGFSISRLKP